MKSKRLLLLLLLAIGLPWAAKAQDLADYTYTTGVDATRWITLDNPQGALTSGYHDDDASNIIAMGTDFSFPFGNGNYTNFWVNSNGMFSFSSTTSGNTSANMSSASYFPKICGISKDLGTGNGGYINYQLTGTAPNRVFVCEYAMGYSYGNYTPDVTWQIQLHEAGSKVVIIYGGTPSTSPSSYQSGLGQSSSDFWIMNPSDNSVSHKTSSYTTTSSGWHGAYRYYEFNRPVVTCPKPTDLVCTAYTATTATLSWTENGTATNWVIEYADNANFTGAQTANASGTPSKQLTGLTAELTYYARVKAICDEDSDWSNPCEFKPTAAQTVTIGSGTGTTYYFPSNPNYDYSYTQQIYTAAEIGQIGAIKSVSFKGNNAGTRTFVVYMANTTKETFADKTDVIPIADATQVFSGSVTFTANEWKTIELAGDGFDYDGNNLAIIVDDNSGDWDMGTTYWASFSVTGNQAVYFYQDDTNINPASPSASNNSVSTSKNQIILSILPSSTPKPRNLVVSDITSESATVTWTAPADNVTGYQYQYKYATTPTWPETWNSLAANVTHKDLVALAANTLYDFRVRANYAEGDSDPAEIQFTTEATCLPVTNISVSDITSNSAKLAWTPGGSETSWQYLTLAHGDTPDWTSERVITSNTHANVPANIYACTGVQPQPNTEYDFYVRANCGGGDYSEAAMLTFRTACGAITSLPWTEDFNSYSTTATSYSAPSSYPNDEMPGCWTFLNRSESTSNYPQVFLSSYSTYAVSGNCLFFKSSSTTPLYAVLPEFSSRIAELKLTFTYRNEGTSTSNGTLYVGYMTNPNDASTFNEQDKIACAQTTTKTTVTVKFANAPDGSHFAFKYQGGTSNNYYLSIDDVIVEERVLVIANQVVNEGNVVNDYQMTWDQFAEHVNNGHEFIDAISLMEDITINTTVGTEAHPFMGTFNGQGYTITMADGAFGNSTTYTNTERCAPFQRTQGATIRNLNTTGSIYTSAKCAAGLIGYTEGNCTITNCHSDVIITSTVSNDGTNAGLIAVTKGGTVYSSTIEGCAFSGKLLGENTGGSGGLVGYNNQVLTITNCVVAPTEVTMTCAGETSATFARNGGTLNINNSYYNNITFGGSPTLQGKVMFSITGVSPVTVASSESSYDYYSVSDISAYTTGVMYKGTIYAGEGETVTLTLSGAPGYEANHGTLTANGDNFTLTMEAYDTEISGIDCPVPYNVAANNVDAQSAQITWTGNSDSYTLQYREVITAPVDENDTYDFEDGTQGWTTIDADGHGDAWSRNNGASYAHGGSYSMKATYNYNYAHQDYLVSPQITLGGTLSFYAKKGGSYADKFRVYLSTGGNTSASDFTIELTDGDVTPTTDYAEYTYDLSTYSGMGYVAIVYTAAANQLSLYVDDITYTTHIAGDYGAWQTVNDAVSPQPIGSLTPETTYQVKVMGTCAGVPTDYSDVVEFTTPATCPAPTELAVTDGSVTAHEATITWTENGEATTWIVEYADNADFSGALTETVEDNATYSFDELDGETTYYVRVKAHCDEEDESDYSNVVNFTTLVACPVPTVLTVTEISTTSAKLSWTENGTATAWQICLNGDETNLIAANSTPFTLGSLTVATSYTVKVRANCGGIDGESAWSNTVSFATECDVITITEDNTYRQGFEGYQGTTHSSGDVLPVCWDSYSEGSTLPHITSSGSYHYVHEGTNTLYFYGAAQTNSYVALPEFTNGLNTLQINFWMQTESGAGYGELSLGYITTEDNNFNTYQVIETYENHTSSMVEITTQIKNVPATATRLAFRWAHPSTSWHGCCIDDVEVSLLPTFTKTIVGVGEENWDGGKGGYYLVASPLAEDVDPATVNGMLTADEGEGEDVVLTYDLYSFNQAQELEWQNYRTSNFNLVNGTGYLYASKNGTTLTFTGAPGTNGQVNLVYDSNAEEFAGWNLVGNPFGEDAYITKSFYTLENSDTYTVNTSSDAIQPMQGLLVVADEDGETLTFTPAEAPAGSKAKLNMNVSKDRSVVDQAIISFNEGQQLPKLQFRNGSTKVYIPQDGKDYAIVSAESMGTMPVNFKAENDGTYTLSFTAEEVSFAYLHLIDNMTGIETDLLANPSYSFEAKTTDYESRFKLVFATGNNANDDAFAFFSNGSFVINNEGEATLQVIEVNGRILKSESINGCANVNVKASAGVYMLRLVNGNDVKVQKVVVR